MAGCQYDCSDCRDISTNLRSSDFISYVCGKFVECNVENDFHIKIKLFNHAMDHIKNIDE